MISTHHYFTIDKRDGCKVIMKIQNMRYFICVAENRYISEAARRIYISQSTISSALQEIEKELGIILFERSRGGVVLTPDGEDCLQYCREIVEKTDALTDRYNGGNLSADYFAVTACHLPVAMRAFGKWMTQSDLPSYNLCIREDSITGVLEDVMSGRSSLGVISFSEEQWEMIDRHYKNAFRFVPMGELRKFVFIKSNHPLAAHKSVAEEDLAPYPYVTYDQGETSNAFSEEKIFYKRFPKTIHVSDRATKLGMIRNTDAFTIGVDLPNFSSDYFFRKTAVELTAIPMELDQERFQIGYIVKTNSTLDQNGKAYLECLCDEIKKIQENGKNTKE